MLIDWFTVGAQALNFIILVWLLKRFLYKPILNAVDAREKRIAPRSRTPTRKKPKPKRSAKSSSTRTRVRPAAARRPLEQGDRRGESRARRLLDDARNAADVLSAKQQETLRSDADNLNDAIGARHPRLHSQANFCAAALRASPEMSCTRSVMSVFPVRFDTGQNRHRQLRHCERSEAIQCNKPELDCFVARAPSKDGVGGAD